METKNIKTNDKLIWNNQEYIFQYPVVDTTDWCVYAHTDKGIIKIAEDWKSPVIVKVYRNYRDGGWQQL